MLLASPNAQIIDTYAGGGPNDVPAISANLGSPTGVAVGADGNWFVTAGGQNRAFKIDPSGQLTSFAGFGAASFDGDGGPATLARLWNPWAAAVDAAGNVFIADRANSRIRRVDALTGIITTVAGNGSVCCVIDGIAATENGMGPTGIALDADGNLLIADRNSHTVRRVDAATGIITTVAGSTTQGIGLRGFSGDGGPATQARLAWPAGVTLDSKGNLFIADEENRRVRRVDARTGIITTVAGTGIGGTSGDGSLATLATMARPVAVAVDSRNNLLILDAGYHRVRRVDAQSGIISTIAGGGSGPSIGDGGPATSARLAVPYGIALDADDNLLIADTDHHRIRRVDNSSGIITTIAGNGERGFSGDGGPAPRAGLMPGIGLAFDSAGDLLIADGGNRRIRHVAADTGIITTVVGSGVFGAGGDGGPAIDANFMAPSGLARDAEGNLFIADERDHRVRKVDAATGTVSAVAGTGEPGFYVIVDGEEVDPDGGPATSAPLYNPLGLAVDTAGNLFIADYFNSRIRRVDATSGIITTVAGNGNFSHSGNGGPATEASLNRPFSVALDAADNLFIADEQNSVIRRVDAATGIITAIAGTGLYRPRGVFVDADENLYIADTSNSRIRRVDGASGIVTTIAGTGTSGFSGDGGPATSARLTAPMGIALDARGNLFFVDAYSGGRIRWIADPTIAIEIDIRPGDAANAINPTRDVEIPVAILGSEDFDVSGVDGTALRFAAGEATPSHDLSDPEVFADHLEDVNGDGFADLVSHYSALQTGIQRGDTVACLRGSTLEGAPIEGCDAIHLNTRKRGRRR